MSFFRPRVFTDSNIPQMQSGKVRFVIGAYRIGVPILSLDSAMAFGISAATSAPTVVGPYTATPPSLSLTSAVPGISVSAHSP